MYLLEDRRVTKAYMNQAYLLFKILDDKVERLYSPALGARFTERIAERADYIGVNDVSLEHRPEHAHLGILCGRCPAVFQPVPCRVIKG